MGNHRQNPRFKSCFEKIDDIDISLKPHEKLCVAITLLVIFLCILCVYYVRTADESGLGYVRIYYYASEDLSALNTATATDLLNISGIGSAKAQAIIECRDALGGFKDYGQLVFVNGISEKLAGVIMDYYNSDEREQDNDTDTESNVHDRIFEVTPHFEKSSDLKKCVFVCLR